jgi:CTP:phosphocholine cytidylyltransferase-like protein
MNAIIMAAGTSSRFVPLSVERPKGLLEVKGEILIERQIRQLQEAGVDDITIVTGYKAAMFEYLRDKYGVETVYNEDYNKYNNTSSIIRVIDRLSNTFICCSDHYFKNNVFKEPANESYYAARYAKGETGEYCLSCDNNDYITGVSIGGRDAWYMAGHVFFNDAFSDKFRSLMIKEYNKECVRNGYWEDVYIDHIKDLPMQIRRYLDEAIFEFDTLDELRTFDESYVGDTRSRIVKEIGNYFSCKDGELHGFQKIKHNGDYLLFSFFYKDKKYEYDERNPMKINQINQK